jgi:hypothetical protein
MWPLLDLLLNGRLKKIKCSRSTPRVYRNSDRGFLYFQLIKILGDINPSLLAILERLVAHKFGSLQMLDLVFKRLHLCGLIYT